MTPQTHTRKPILLYLSEKARQIIAQLPAGDRTKFINAAIEAAEGKKVETTVTLK